MAEEPDALVVSSASRQPVLDDPRAGRVEGARRLGDFAAGIARCLRERDAVVENAALTLTPLRTVEKVVVRLLAEDGGRVELPAVVVSERNPDRTLKAVRVYHSFWPLTGEHRVSPPLLPEDPNLHAEGVPGDYQRALAEGDLAGIVGIFEPGGYVLREPSGGAYLHRGEEGLRKVYVHMFANGGGIPLEHYILTDDDVRCAIEYTCVRWGLTDMPPQAGVAVYERRSSGLLSAGRIYDDGEPPAVSETSVG